MNAELLPRVEAVLFPGGRAILPVPLRRALHELLIQEPRLAPLLLRHPLDPSIPLAEARPRDHEAAMKLDGYRADALAAVDSAASKPATPIGAPPSFAAEDATLTWLLTGFGESIPRLQRMLLDALHGGLELDVETLSIGLTPGLMGVGVLVVLDTFEVIARLARMCGLSARPARLEIIALEHDAESIEVANRLVERWRSPERNRGRYFWRRDELDVRILMSWPEHLETDLLLVPLLEGAPLTADEAASWSTRIKSEGLLVVGEAGHAGKSVSADISSQVAPFVAPNEPDVSHFLERFFGFQMFREGQWPIVERILTGRSVLGVLPTGAGKTVCFQLPALLQPGVAIVVSPLVSLIDDQLINLRARGMEIAGGINGAMSESEQRRELDRFTKGTRKLFYLSPERLQIASFRNDLAMAVSGRQVHVSMLVVDEAHIASEWGHDFRPSYLGLPDHAADIAPGKPVVLLTATASDELRKDLLRMFQLTREAEIRPPGFDRPELGFDVVRVANEEARRLAVVDLIQHRLPQALNTSDDPFGKTEWGYEHAGLILTPWKKRTKPGGKRTISLRAPELAELLALELDVPVDFYVSSDETDLSDARKRYTQERFKEDRLPIVVATKGFGTGIDKPNVRWVIHTAGSGSIEGYYQEVGRAGRDRENALGVMLLIPQAADCRKRPVGERPPCIDGRCPYGLPEPCNFGRQAFLLSGSLRGVDEDYDTFFTQLNATLGPYLVGGETCQLPTDIPVTQIRAPKDFERLLNLLKDIGVISQWRTERSANLPCVSVRIGKASELELRKHLQIAADVRITHTELVEKLVLKLGVLPRLARDAAAVWANYFRRWPDGHEDRQCYPATRGEPVRSLTEHLLYRLFRLEVVSEYLQVKGKWSVEIRPYDLDRLMGALKGFVARVVGDDSATLAAWMARFQSTGDPLEDTARALHLSLEAHYEVYALRRWQQLTNLEDYAQSSECRKARLHAFLGAEPPPSPCHRCDICGIEPLEPNAERTAAPAGPQIDALILTLRNRPSSEVLENLFAVASDNLPFLRDRSLKRLEDDPNDLGALTAVARTYDELDDRERRNTMVERIRQVLLFRRSASDTESTLRALPPNLANALFRDPTLVAILGDEAHDLLQFDLARALGDGELQIRAATRALSRTLRAQSAQ